MSKKLSFCAFMSALGTICIILTVIIPTAKVFFFLSSTLFTYICTSEYGKRYGLLVFIVISAICFLILPSKIPVFIYVFSAGYYPIFKHFTEHLNIPFFVKYTIKCIFCIAVTFAVYFILKTFFMFKINILIMLLPVIVIFFIYDTVLSYGISFYALRLRKHKI